MHACAYTGMHAHARAPETMKGKFLCIKDFFGMNPTSFGRCSKPLFSDYKNPYMVPLQNTLKSIFFWLRPFLVLIFEFQGLNNLF